MAQKRFDGKDEPPKDKKARRQIIKEKLLTGDSPFDYDEKVEDGIRLGLFSLKTAVDAAYKNWRSEIESAARSMKDKSGLPLVIPVSGHPHQGVLLDVGRHEDRWLNLIRRGLAAFGHQKTWQRCQLDMDGREEETPPVAEWKEGWPEIQARYQLEAAKLGTEADEEED